MTNLNSPFLNDSPSTFDVEVKLHDAKRLAFIEQLEIVDEPRERSLKIVVQLATKLLNVPVSLITMVLEDRQFFVASEGLSEEWEICRQTPLSHSFCRHVVEGNMPLIVSNASSHPLVADNLAIPELGVAAYLGVPIQFGDDAPIGALCVIDSQPRSWTQQDLSTLEKLSSLTCAELAVRQQANREQKQLELQLRQAQKAEAIGQCVVGVAHDINNILGAVHTTTEVLECKLAQQENVSHEVEQIKNTIGSAKTLMKRLSRWGSPGDRMKPQPLTQIVRDALPVLRACVNSRIDINYESFDSDEQTCIVADEGEISQLLLNLCTNSEHAMGDNSGAIQIEVRQVQSKTTAQAELTVTDRGSGIDPKIMHRIHDPYFTTKPLSEGNGLGLWTVFVIVRGHKAEIDVDSTVGVGTRVIVRFPVAETVIPADHEQQNVPVSSRSSSQIRKVLLVDDNEVIIQGMEWLLSNHGYEVVSCTDSLDALQTFQKSPESYDLVISDRRMPKMSGEELLAAIKVIRDEIPTILCSGVAHLPGTDLPTCADAFCLKPWSIEELNAVITKIAKP